MVRLVFRPYTQIRRTICTSVSLRASTRVSPGFTLFRHRSPSFGSQQICYYSNLPQANDRSIVPPTRRQDSYLNETSSSSLSFCIRVLLTQILAYMLDSLVRVSRRVEDNHFVRTANPPSSTSKAVFTFRTDRTLFSHALGQTDLRVPTPESGGLSLLTQRQRRLRKLNKSEEMHQLTQFLRDH